MFIRYGSCLLIILVAIILTTTVDGAQQDSSSFALLDVDTPRTGFHRTRICSNFQQFFLKSLPKSAEHATPYNLGWWNNTQNQFDVCIPNFAILKGLIIPLTYVSKNPQEYGVCKPKPNETNYIQLQMDRLVSVSAAAGLFLLDKGTDSAYHGKNYLFSRFYNPEVTNNTPVFYLYKQQFEDIMSKVLDPSETVLFRFYRPADPFMDASVFVLLLLSAGCILVACLWYASSLCQKISTGEYVVDYFTGHLVDANEDRNSPVRQDLINSRDQEKVCCFTATTTCIHICYTIQALAIVVIVLLLSYFYREVAVEFFNVFAIIGGTISIQKCLTPIIRLCVFDPEFRSLAQILSINEARRPERCWIPAVVYHRIRPVACVILTLAFVFCLAWRLNLNWNYAYLMLDFMNICICIYSVKASELRSLRLITFFLIAMFVYDIVMVFGTRLLTENGCSVMVQVVTGMDCIKQRKTDYSHDWPVPPIVGGTSRPQKIPLLFYVPLLSNPVGHCYDTAIEGEYQHMMLGLGDVIAPGYLIAFAFYLDVRKGHKFHLYGFTAVVGYALGMISTFISLKLMETPQPALIYLVPFTLIPFILLCVFKGVLHEAWSGKVTSA